MTLTDWEKVRRGFVLSSVYSCPKLYIFELSTLFSLETPSAGTKLDKILFSLQLTLFQKDYYGNIG